MNSKNRKTPDPHSLLLNLTDKINLKRICCSIKPYHILYMEKCKKGHIRAISLKYHLQHGMKNLNYLMYHILYQIFQIILSISLKTWRKGY